MTRQRIHYYEVLTYIAYGFYLLLSLAWVVVSFYNNHRFNFFAFFVLVVFAVQTYYKHLLTNLILGVLLFFISIIGALETYSGLSGGDVMLIDKVLFAIPAVSVLMSGILIFSYMKLNFRN